ncbi:MAG: tRNA uracil 4-sulfurtransferase ThiI [Oscillospiraceae bacterium]|jgi:thiamine biosynthesis protein ThiI
MKEILLAKYGEVVLKGLNRHTFEEQLEKTVRRRLQDAGSFSLRRSESVLYVEPCEGADIDLAEKRLSMIFGFSTIDRAAVCLKDIDAICRTADEYMGKKLDRASTFKVACKRSDKSFPMNSMEISSRVGAYILERHPSLRAKMDDPDVVVRCEVRDRAAYVHGDGDRAAGGIPTGTSGRAAVMMSGGIDSPVAAFMMAKRGLSLAAVHFMAPPYTSERARDKVVKLCSILSGWVGSIPLICVPFTDVQLELKKKCPEELFTVLMRRSMVRITNMVCGYEKCGAMVTGESLGQVASQTLPAISCTDDSAEYPVLRPLIGMDKVEIIDTARRIGTYETSILPYEDCCTVFTPRHPAIKPRLSSVRAAEERADLAELEKKAFEARQVQVLHFYDKVY